MNKVFVTGLALGIDHGMCNSCNFDLEWILDHPSIFLWADKVVVSSSIWDSVFEAGYPDHLPELSKSIKLLFEMAKAENIIEVVSTKEIMADSFSDYLHKEVENDRVLLAKEFPEQIKFDDKVPGGLFIGRNHYCTPSVWQIYAGLFLSQAVGAQCLFSKESLEYCKYKFGLGYTTNVVSDAKFDALQKIFEAFVPNEPIIHDYAYKHRGQCTSCKNEKVCPDKYLTHVEENFDKVLKWRSYDELKQIRTIVNNIIAKKEAYGDFLVAEDVVREFNKERNEIRKNIHSLFPKVKRWANVTTMVSVPVAIAGAFSGIPALAATATTIAGASLVTKEAIDMFSSKNRWVSFTTKGA